MINASLGSGHVSVNTTRVAPIEPQTKLEMLFAYLTLAILFKNTLDHVGLA